MPNFDTFFRTSAHGNNSLNVKSSEYGPPAVGDGLVDDTVALQSKFNAAWGTKEAPHGNDAKYANRAIYIPPGNYKHSQSLYITAATGGKIFGDSARNTFLSFANPMAGNYWRPSGAGSEISSALVVNGCAFLTLEGFAIGTNNLDAASVCIDICNIGGLGMSTMPFLTNMEIGGCGHGLMVGYADSGGNSENGIVYGCNFGSCMVSGIKLFHANILNWNVLGGGASESATVPNPSGMAAYCAVTGAFSLIAGVSLSANGMDFRNAGGSTMTIQGGSTEGYKCAQAVSSPIHLNSFAFRGYFDDPVFADAESLGVIKMDSCAWDPRGGGNKVIGKVGSNGIIICDNLMWGSSSLTNSHFEGSPGGSVWLRGVNPFPGSDLFPTSSFTGRVMQWEPSNPTTLAAMPARASFASCTRLITDLTSNTAGDTAVGGGSLKGYCWCDGTNWKVIGPVT